MIMAVGGEGSHMIISIWSRVQFNIPLPHLPSIPDPLSCPWSPVSQNCPQLFAYHLVGKYVKVSIYACALFEYKYTISAVSVKTPLSLG